MNTKLSNATLENYASHMDTTKPQYNDKLFAELIYLCDEERLIRFERKAEKKGFDDLARFLKERRKALGREAKA